MGVSIKFADLPPEALIRMPQLRALTGLGKTSIYKYMRAGVLPKPVRLGERLSAWRAGEVSEALQRIGAQAAKGTA